MIRIWLHNTEKLKKQFSCSSITQFFNLLRFLVFEALEVNDAKAYVKKPKPGKAARPFHNKRPPTTTLRGNKRPRPEDDVEDGFTTQSPAPPPNTGNDSHHMVLS